MWPDQRECYWYDALPQAPQPRTSLAGEREADVAVVGAGYTGLWTAYFLKRLEPALDIVVLEAEHAGFGASGRNGGWLMGSIDGLEEYLQHCDPGQRGVARAEVYGLVTAAAEVLQSEGIDCDFAHGGGLYLAARFPEQRAWARDHLAGLREAGVEEADWRWLEPDAVAARTGVARQWGGLYTPHIAAVQPARLVQGLAQAVERAGVKLFEGSPVLHRWGEELVTPGGRLRAPLVVQATEGLTRDWRSLQRYVLPFQSGMVASEPLSPSLWQEIGLAHREVLCDYSRLSTYAQRTADDRLVFGARGHYCYGGKPEPGFASTAVDRAARIDLARQFFPQLEGVEFTHAWGGSLGIPRRFAPHVVYDPESGYATAGGYVGEGVGASFLFGRTLAELIAGRDTARTGLPWVFRGRIDRALRRWEPEPLRWLGFRSAWGLFAWEESVYRKGNAPRWQRGLARTAANTAARFL